MNKNYYAKKEERIFEIKNHNQYYHCNIRKSSLKKIVFFDVEGLLH